MKFKLIDREKRKEVRCYYCDTDKSVKYKVLLFNNNTIKETDYRYCCNKCILMLISEDLRGVTL